MTTTTVTCGACGREIDEDPGLAVKPPCPHCRSSARSVHIHASDTATAVDEVVSLERVREYVKRDPFWTVVLALIIVAGAIASWLLSRWLVFVVAAALVFGLLRYFVGPRASARVIEREKLGPFR